MLQFNWTKTTLFRQSQTDCFSADFSGEGRKYASGSEIIGLNAPNWQGVKTP